MMERLFIHDGLFVALTPKMGWGVFTSLPIPAGTVVERSPVIVMTKAERELLDRTRLHDYIFEWGEISDPEKKCAKALGWVAVYNHSYQSNCEYEMDLVNECISITAVRDIAAGEELFINYNGDWNDGRPVWFQPA